jgi:hypothetical protein
VKPTDKPGVVQTPLGTVNLGTMRPLTERDLVLAQNISPAQAKTIKELMDVQKDFRAYSIDVAKLGIQQAELNLNERRTRVAEANLAIDQAKLEQTNADQEGIIEELNANNSELEKKIEEYKTGVVIMPEVTVGGKKYQVNNGTLHNGVRYSREELAKNESVCESILAINGQLTITPLNVEEAN